MLNSILLGSNRRRSSRSSNKKRKMGWIASDERSSRWCRANEMIRGMQRVDLAYAHLASSEVARESNRDVVLEVVRANQPISRAELAGLSGLQRGTVSLIVNQLIEERWVLNSG